MKYWCEDSAVLTHYYNALSVLFPAWEELFCKVAGSYKDSVDSELRSDIDKFIKQEQSHANAHHSHNKRYDLLAEETLHRVRAEVLAKRPKNRFVLGAMVSIEHMAASLGRDFLDRYSNQASKEYKLFAWHSREEIEHKALAYNVFKAIGGSKETLHRAAKTNLRTVVMFILKHVASKITEEKLWHKPSTWIDLGRLSSRLVTSLVIPYFTIFTDSFDPENIDDSKYLQYNKA